MEGIMAHLTTGHIKQLIEIDNVGHGIRAEIQALIAQLTLGGVGTKVNDIRVEQAKNLWDKGFGREQGYKSFEDYLLSIPYIPKDLVVDDDNFPNLVLVDARLGIEQTCKLLRVDPYSVSDEDSISYREENQDERVYWMRAQSGWRNRRTNYAGAKCFRDFERSQSEDGLTANEALALYALGIVCKRYPVYASGTCVRNHSGRWVCLEFNEHGRPYLTLRHREKLELQHELGAASRKVQPAEDE